VNSDNMICLINSQYIMTHDLSAIVEIETIKQTE
jgi:hypothetical protein